MSRRWLVTAVLLFLTAALGGCASGSAGSDGRPSIVAAFYPLAFVAERVSGRQMNVTDLTPSGGEPHDVELGPQQVAAMGEADLVVYERGFQPAVDEAITQAGPRDTLDVAQAVPLHGGDPHVWLDPLRLARVAEAFGAKVAAMQPSGAAAYRERAAALARELRGLDREFRDGLRSCESRVMVTTHDAFGYLARRYGLQPQPLSGVSPEAEPSPRRLAEVTRLIARHEVETVFFETLVSPRTAKALAADAGARTAVLDPLEGLADPQNEDYFSVMRDNLAALRKGLGCS